MPRVIHFEFEAGNPERTAEFYTKVFGGKVHNWDGPEDYWLITTGPEDKPGIDGAIMRSSMTPARTINTVEVPYVDEFIKRIAENGGKVLGPKMTIPGVGYHSYCQDTEGNTFGIIQHDSSANQHLGRAQMPAT